MRTFLRRLLARRRAQVVRAANPPQIDVRRLIEELSDDDLMRSADAYFAQLTTDSTQYKKPFFDPTGTGHVGQSLGLLFDAGEFFRGATVLDFGCGTGWLSLGLAQAGCHAIGVDISPAALRLAEHLKATRRVDSDGTLTFMAYDGRHLPLPDASLDRIVCFDAFHHVRDQEGTLREFARVLRQGGRIAFVEPGPNHSKTVQSQLEMANFKVIENDIRMDEIAAMAARCGLGEPQMLVQWLRPVAMPLARFNDWAQNGVPWSSAIELARLLRADMTNRSCFSIDKGELSRDSRRAVDLGGRVRLLEVTPASLADAPAFQVRLVVKNTGTGRWITGSDAVGHVNLGCQLFGADGTAVHLARLPLGEGDVAVGQERVVTAVLPLPAGTGYRLHFDLVAEHVAWFSQIGCGEPATLDAATLTQRLAAVS